MSGYSEITNQLRVTKRIYSSIFTGLLLFLIIVIVIIQDNNAEGENNLDNIFTVIVPLFGLMIMVISKLVYNRMNSGYLSGTDLVKKIMRYRTAKIISWALVEAACFFALVATLLTSNYLYIVVVIFLLGYFFMLRPSRQSLINDLQLNSSEEDLIPRN
jgi:hypothetical protein